MTQRVCFIITGLAYGGAELQLVKLAKNFVLRGWTVSVVSLMQPKAFVEELEALGVHVFSTKLSRKSPVALVSAAIKIRRHLIKFKPDIVHSHLVHANILSRVLRLFYRMPVLVCTCHSMTEGGQLRNIAYRLTDHLANLTTYVSQAALTAALADKRVAPSRAIVVYNGIDLDHFLPVSNLVDSGVFKWVSVGRLVPSKGVDVLLRAFALSPEHFHLSIVGDGEQLHNLQSLSSSLGIDHRVSFLGHLNDVAPIIYNSNAFILASHYEGYGLVVAEAMACGRPAIVTACGGPEEIVSADSTCGYIVPINDPESLSQAMIAMAVMPAPDFLKMGEQSASRIAKYFDIRVVSDRWISIYKELS